MKSKLIVFALGVGAAGFAMAQNNQASDPSSNNQTQPDATAQSTSSSSNVNSSANTNSAAIQTDDDVVRTLSQASFDNRKDALQEVSSHIGKAHRSAMKSEVKNVFHKESADMKAAYKTAKEEEKSARTDVKDRLNAAQNSTADNWETNRTALAQAYERYTQAAAKVDAFGQNQNQSQNDEDNTPASSAQDQSSQNQTTTPQSNPQQ